MKYICLILLTCGVQVFSDRRAFVCITGQITRLELDNKVRTLLLPLQQHMDHIDVALILSQDRHAHFVNVFRDVGKASLSPFHNIDDATHALESAGVRHVHSSSYTQSQQPILNPDYLNILDKRAMSNDKRIKRAQIHVRQFEALAHCYFAMQALDAPYDLVVRLRDDAVLPSPLNMTHMMMQVKQNTIVASNCATWGGLNDKGAFVHPSVAKDFFMAPLLDYYLKPMNKWVHNPESYYRRTYERHKMNIVKDKTLFILTRRFMTSGPCTHWYATCEHEVAKHMTPC